MNKIPPFFEYRIFDLSLWNIGKILLLLIGGYLIFKLLVFFFAVFLRKILKKMNVENLARRFFQPVAKPISLLVIIYMYQVWLPSLQLPAKFNSWIQYVFIVFYPLLITWISYNLIGLFAGLLSRLARKTSTQIDDNLIPFLRKTLKVVVIIFGGIYILISLNINITPLLAGVSIGGLALALAAQETVKNLFGSVTILTDQPFRVGEDIVFDGASGTVEDIGMRSTKIRTINNSLVTIPNGKLADITIDNISRRKYRRFNTQIGILYSTPLLIIEEFVSGIRKIVKEHQLTRKDFFQVYMNNFGDSSINIIMNIFFEVDNYDAELRCRHEIIARIITLAESMGVSFAFPTRSLYIENLNPNLISGREGSK